MKANRTTITIVVVLVLIVVVLAGLQGAGKPRISMIFVAQFESAKKQPSPDLFTVTDANLNGETRKAIAIAPTAGTCLL